MRGVVLPPPTEDFTADPVELFFDLSYVFVFAQLVFELAHNPTWPDAARSVVLLTLIWITWTQFTWSANAVSGNARPVRMWFLLATVAAVPMGASVGTAFGAGGLAFAGSQIVILAMGLLTMAFGLPAGSAVRDSLRVYATPNVIAMVVILGGLLVEGDARLLVWLVAILTMVLGGMVRAGSKEWLVRPGHFAERHGLILIVALGEVVVASGIGVAQALDAFGDGGVEQTPAGATFLALGAAAALAALLWFAYFDRAQEVFEHVAGETPAADRGRFARDVWSLWHLPIIAGVIATAAALEEVTLHPQEPLHLEFRVMLAFGLLLFLLGGVGAIWRATRVFVAERTVATVLLAAVILAPVPVDAVVLAVLVDVLLLALFLLEERHPRSVDDHDGHGHASA